MKKREFLQELKMRLKGIDNIEQESILNYYDEMISDKVDEGYDEERFIRSLGTFDEIMRKLNIPYDEKERSKIKYDSIITNVNQNDDYDNSYKEDKRRNQNNNNANNKQTSKYENKKEFNPPSAGVIVLIVLTFPIWFTVLMTAFSLIITAVGIIIGFMVAGIAIAIGGIGCIIVAFTMFSVSSTAAIIAISGGLIILGVGCLLTPITLKLGFYILKQSSVAIKKTIKLLQRK